jgi:hypothetical protein
MTIHGEVPIIEVYIIEDSVALFGMEKGKK